MTPPSHNFVKPKFSGGGTRGLGVRPLAIFGLVAAGTLAAVLWPRFPEKSQTALIAEITVLTPDPTPVFAQGRTAKPVSTGPIVSLAADPDRDSVRAYEPDGKAFTVNLGSGTKTVLSDQPLTGFLRSIWVPRARQVISVFDTKQGPEYRFYDYAGRKTAVIGTSITGLAVSPDGRYLSYARGGDGTTTLYVSDASGDNARKIMDTRAVELRLDWPAGDTLSLGSRRPDRAGADLWRVGLDGSLSVLLSNRENLEYAWSPDGGALLYSHFVPGYGIRLFWLKAASPALEVATGLSTSAAKCAWLPDSTGFVCGVPAGTELPRDVAADRTATVDDIVSFDLRTQEAKTLATTPKGSLVGVIEPVMTGSGNYFAFRNLFDRRLWVFGL